MISSDAHRETGRRRTLLVILCLPMSLVLLDVLAMNVAMPTLGQALAVPVGEWPRVVDAYTLPLALALLPCGWVVDRCGARPTLLAGVTFFTLCSVAGALAAGWTAVLLARCGQGLAAAAMLPAGLAMLSQVWHEPGQRARALGTWSSVSAAATALGPAVGGLLVGLSSWRAVFWVNVPLGVVAALGTWRLVPVRPPRTDQGSVAQAGPEEPARGMSAPTKIRPLVGSVVAAALMTCGANGTLQIVTVHLQAGLGMAAGPAGAVLLVGTAPFVLLGPVSGRAVGRLGRRRVATMGFIAGAFGLATLGRLPGLVGLVPGLLGIGVGLGLMTSAIVGETLAAWAARPGTASGLNNALRQAGTSAGVALGGWAAGTVTGERLVQGAGAVAALCWLAGGGLALATFSRRSPAAG